MINISCRGKDLNNGPAVGVKIFMQD